MGWDDNGLNVERRVQLTATASRAIPRSPTTRRSSRPTSRPSSRSRSRGPTSSSCAARSPSSSSRRTSSCGRASGLSVDWRQTYTTIGTKARRTSQRGFLQLLRRRPRLSRRGADAVGRRLQDVGRAGRARGPRASRRVPPHRVHEDGRRRARLHRDHPSRARSPRASRSSPTPTTRATSRSSAAPCGTPLFERRGPRRRARARRSREGVGHRDDLHVRRHHRRHLVARARAARPVDRRSRRSHRPEPSAGRHRERGVVRDLRHARSRRRRPAWSRCSPSRATWSANPSRSPTRSSSGRTATGHSRSSRAGSGSSSTRRPTTSRPVARELRWFPDFMRVRYENWVNGLAGDWNITRQRFFGVPFPVWYPVLEDGSADRSRPIVPSEDRLPVDPSTDVPDGYDESQRDKPGGFVGDPDVMDTWATSSLVAAHRRRLGRRPRSVRACLPDGHASAGPRDHPHMALLQRRALRRSCTAACRGTTPRSRASCTTQIARSCRSRRATATTTRTTCSTRSAPTRSGTGRATAAPDRTSPSTRTR